jgi:hypothetical protein
MTRGTKTNIASGMETNAPHTSLCTETGRPLPSVPIALESLDKPGETGSHVALMRISL